MGKAFWAVTRVTAGACALALAVAGCSDGGGQDSAPAAAASAGTAGQPPSPSPSPSPSPLPSPSPSPAPKPSPLSAFEGDPAVAGLRTYLRAVSDAVNAKNLQLPSLLAASTAARAGRHQQLYGENLGSYFPGPRPVAVLGVRAVDATRRVIVGCQLSNYALDKPGGKLLVASAVAPGTYAMVLQGGTWKLDKAQASKDVSCAGVVPPVVKP